MDEERAAELNLNLQDRRLRLTLELARTLIGFPRHLSQHPGGFVLTEDRLDDLVPIEPAAHGQPPGHRMGQGRHRRAALHEGRCAGPWHARLHAPRLRSAGAASAANGSIWRRIPAEDPATYAMIRKADTLGTFQIESRAQMSMLPRLKPRTFYDLVIQVAIVRPGPIQGDMVHPYLRRREGMEKVEYPTPELRRVLEKTLGVPLFQEQAMQVAIVCAGFTPSEADQLRRSMATFKFTGGVQSFQRQADRRHGRARLHAGIRRDRRFQPDRRFRQLRFSRKPRGQFRADRLCLVLAEVPPSGRVLLRAAERAADGVLRAGADRARRATARRRGPAGLRQRLGLGLHAWNRRRGRYLAVRLGLRMAKGLASAHADEIVAQRARRCRIARSRMLWRRARVPVAALERLAEADAFSALGLDRRQALWAIRGLADARLPLFDAARVRDRARPATRLRARAGEDVGGRATQPRASWRRSHRTPRHPPPMTAGREVVEDYRSTGLQPPPPSGVLPARRPARTTHRRAAPTLPNARDGQRLTVAGIVLVRQRPGSARGVLFITIEDETGHANLIVWPSVFDRQRRLVLTASMLACRGKVQREGEVIHVIADHLTDLSPLLRSVGQRGEDFPTHFTRADHFKHPAGPDPRETKGIKVPTRDFR